MTLSDTKNNNNFVEVVETDSLNICNKVNYE